MVVVKIGESWIDVVLTCLKYATCINSLGHDFGPLMGLILLWASHVSHPSNWLH